MSTIDSSRRQTDLDIARDAPRDGVATRVFLQPIAAPSILGLFGFAGATFIVGVEPRRLVGHARVRSRTRSVRRDVRRLGAVPRRYVGLPGPRRGGHGDARNLGRLLAR